MGGFGADASGGGRHGMWGSRGVGGDVADLEGLGPQGCDERGGAGTLTCGNGTGGSFFTETALLDEVHSTERFGAREQRRHVRMVQENNFPVSRGNTPTPLSVQTQGGVTYGREDLGGQ